MTDRIETDSIGDIHVPSDCFYGAQTQRSKENFVIGTEKMPIEMVYAMVLIKTSATSVGLN